MSGVDGLLALVVADPDGGFDLCDSRTGERIGWEGQLGDAAAAAAHFNADHPSGTIPPASDSLAFELRMYRIGGEWPRPLAEYTDAELSQMIPAGVDDRPALWKPGGGC